ncbi:DegT/DnrJ/EryC1/StrS family aminotransferase [Acinetobacter sp. LF10]|uniref:DegT/DnrJ/EryC1/StrS family aminotransferase n=1 Tax=Acinetobacter sp. LF10 TaxID=3403576 RepID=UPI003B215423
MTKIPVYQPSLSGREKEYVIDCLDSTWISSKGEYINRFEQEFSKKIGVNHAITVSNGTVALHLALIALGISSEDEVIVPSLTYIASVNAISYTGAHPIFVDSLYDTWQMDPNDIIKKITPRTRAIMVVHLYGHPCDMDAIMQIASEHNLYVIEDCAEAFGSKYKENVVGSIGDIATFSFFGNKTITTGEGGMVVTNSSSLAEKVMHYKGQGLAKNREYWHDVIGYNYRMTNICAAIGLAQIEQADDFIYRKREIATRYRQYLSECPIEVHHDFLDGLHTYWMVSILTNDTQDRDKLRTYLANNGIETRPLFHPIHTMPMYSNQPYHYPIAEDLAKRGINLPSWPTMTIQQQDLVIHTIHQYFQDKP